MTPLAHAATLPAVTRARTRPPLTRTRTCTHLDINAVVDVALDHRLERSEVHFLAQTAYIYVEPALLICMHVSLCLVLVFAALRSCVPCVRVRVCTCVRMCVRVLCIFVSIYLSPPPSLPPTPPTRPHPSISLYLLHIHIHIGMRVSAARSIWWVCVCVPAYGHCQSGTPPCYAAPPDFPALAAHFLASQARSYRPPGNQNAVNCDAGSPGATGRPPWNSLKFSLSLSCRSSRSLSLARASAPSLSHTHNHMHKHARTHRIGLEEDIRERLVGLNNHVPRFTPSR